MGDFILFLIVRSGRNTYTPHEEHKTHEHGKLIDGDLFSILIFLISNTVIILIEW